MSLKTALVIDDDRMIRQIVRTVLVSFGYEAYGAPSGERGLEMAQEKRPGIIILDRHMPDVDGNEVLKILKSRKTTQNIPVVMLSAESQIEEVKSSIDLGANGYIIKPFKAKEFMEKIEKVLQSHHGR